MYHSKVSSRGSVAEILTPAQVIWVADSLRALRGFPKAAQYNLGYALRQVQLGQTPLDSKPMRTVGQGVYELRDRDDRAWYRVIYLKKIKNEVHVLHCFEKKTNQTEQKDIDTARQRLKRLKEQQQKELKHGKQGSEVGNA